VRTSEHISRNYRTCSIQYHPIHQCRRYHTAFRFELHSSLSPPVNLIFFYPRFQNVHFPHRHHRPRGLCPRCSRTHREASRRRNMWQHCAHSTLSSPLNKPRVELTFSSSRDTQHLKSSRPSTKVVTTTSPDNRSAAATTLTATTTTKALTSRPAALTKSSRSKAVEFTLAVSPRLRRVLGDEGELTLDYRLAWRRPRCFQLELRLRWVDHAHWRFWQQLCRLL
jgi:hypothetical protein